MSDDDTEDYYPLGAVDPIDRPLCQLRQEIIELFSDDAKKADDAFEDDLGIPLCGSSLTHFAETTAQAMMRRDAARADGHLAVILSAYQRGDEYMKSLVDVNYMEDLFYEVDDDSARWGWGRIHPSLQQLYLNFWGAPRFLKTPKRSQEPP